MMTIWAMLSTFLIFKSFDFGECSSGIDISQNVTLAQFQKFYAAGNTFFIARISRSNDLADPWGVKNILKANQAGFTDVDAYIFPCANNCKKTAVTQVTNALDALEAENAKVGKIWIDVEVPAAWPTNHIRNRQFISDMVNTVEKRGYIAGIYSGIKHWEGICGNWNAYSNYSLWWTNPNKVADLTTGWKDFGGWTFATIHQYSANAVAYGVTYDANVK